MLKLLFRIHLLATAFTGITQTYPGNCVVQRGRSIRQNIETNYFETSFGDERYAVDRPDRGKLPRRMTAAERPDGGVSQFCGMPCVRDRGSSTNFDQNSNGLYSQFFCLIRLNSLTYLMVCQKFRAKKLTRTLSTSCPKSNVFCS